MSNKQVVFATARDTGSLIRQRHTWNKQSFLQLYTTDIDESGKLSRPKRMSHVINSKYHESTPAFTADGMTMYFTRNNFDNSLYGTDTERTNKLKIFRSYKENGCWTLPVSLPFNNDQYSAAHPALSPDEKKLYFSSDMPGSVGFDKETTATMSDIWEIDILADGTFSEPRNLKNINTPGRETFPFVSSSNVLYFASSGHQGLGGLDVFSSSIHADGSAGKVINMGKPINTPYDDFSFIVNDDTRIGYFSSNRPGGLGNDDVYRCIQLEDLRIPCEVLITGTVIDKDTGEPLKGAAVRVIDAHSTLIFKEQVTSKQGTYAFKLECDKEYLVRVTKKDYTTDEDLFKTQNESGSTDVLLEIKSTLISFVDGDDIGPLLEMKQIYFDLDKFNIRSDAEYELAKIKVFMELYPQTCVAIRSHTDSRASDAYNILLSDKRAQSTVNWLVSKGIDAYRLGGKGFGKKRLFNRCSNGVVCSEKEHQLNRRSEFIVSGHGTLKKCDQEQENE
jgi:outer membrane protein OmpA-like peptidoglycan-associated protein